MQFLGIAFFFVIGIGFILFGLLYMKTQKSSVTIRKDGQRKRLTYRGNQAIFHGLLYILVGCVSFFWGLRPILGYAEISWTWCFTGFGILWGIVVIGAMILTIWVKIQTEK